MLRHLPNSFLLCGAPSELEHRHVWCCICRLDPWATQGVRSWCLECRADGQPVAQSDRFLCALLPSDVAVPL
jgi:hypothetical protein